MSLFQCFVLSPAELESPSLLVAAVRAGGIGVLDLEHCPERKFDIACRNLSKLIGLTHLAKEEGGVGKVGLRLGGNQILSSHTLLAQLEPLHPWIVLTRWSLDSLSADIAELSGQNRRIVIEITDCAQLFEIQALQLEIDGLIVKGHESGGVIGADSSFILLQKLAQHSRYPIYVQGGIGIYSAAACRAAGASGVVLDDQLWLMPESPLPETWKAHLENLNGQESIVIGERLNVSVRVLSRPGFKPVEQLRDVAERSEVGFDKSESDAVWLKKVRSTIGWGDPSLVAWPMGQSIGLAASYCKTYRTTGRLIQGILSASRDHLQLAQTLKPLAPGSPLAMSHRTEYPVVQGPMTRVSDTAEFAEAVATQGGLPLLALALMKGAQVRQLLQATQQRLQARSWGIGILGFVPHAVREEQMREILAVKPPFAVIAGGRPDQAAHLESEGIATYLHIPVPALLEMFLEQGARRFIFEGRECGGHVGPLSSFVLWESMIATLLERVSSDVAAEVHVLFAGGIHDARSAAMISAMAAPLVAKGVKIGVLMGSAYLFTEEAVNCGAILSEFQTQALSCDRTVNLETGPGHASRCAVTPFTEEFYAQRRRHLAEGASHETVKSFLEDLTLGRLRIASKGITRDQTGTIVSVEPSQQLTSGMYMIGQVATLRKEVTTVRALHQNVCVDGTEYLSTLSTAAAKPQDVAARPSDIAIIGIASFLPRSLSPETLWNNLLNGVSGLTEIPAHRWDWKLYYDADRAARDKVYSRWGGFLDDIPFDPLQFGIPPKSLKSIDPAQLLTLLAVQQALDDASLRPGDFNGETTSVIFGAGGGIADLGQQYATRSGLPQYVESPNDQVWDRLPEWTEESFPGLLLNVIAGRVANRLDFGGSNFTVDAACASSLAAINLAVQELESGRSDLVVTGGVDTVQNPFAYLCFSKSHALSPRGRPRTFDQNADGIVISEGIGVLVLKRLVDAERDGDRIYAVIKAVAGSSDGKALGMTAPRPAGQMRALERAYKKAGFSPSSLGLYEAHGTGTAAGDKAELETINHSLEKAQSSPNSCAIGSLKTLVGHTKSTAGVAGLTKVALALHHRVLPPHVGVETPLPKISDPHSPVYLLKQPSPWLASTKNPRRGAASAFGFGGTNFHAVLEEYTGGLQSPILGGPSRPWELFLWSATSFKTLFSSLVRLQKALQSVADPGFQDLAYTLARQAEACKQPKVVVAIVASDLIDLQTKLSLAIDSLENNNTQSLTPQVQVNSEVGETPKIALLFPGQGSQYPNMIREVALYFTEVRQALELSENTLQQQQKEPLSQFIYPPGAFSEDDQDQQIDRLKDSSVAQPAIGAVSSGLLGLLNRLEIQPTMVGGHSYGEYVALHGAGCISQEDLVSLSSIRGDLMSAACHQSEGAMAAIQATREEVELYLQDFAGIVLANHNAPLQCVISGPRPLVESLVDKLTTEEITARLLPVAGAFHSPLMEGIETDLYQAIGKATINAPQMPVYSNSTANLYPATSEEIRSQLSRQVTTGVKFVDQIHSMYNSGARVFLEVGPKQVLTRLVDQILAQQPHTAVSLDCIRDQGLQGFLVALATLATQGINLKWSALFDDCQVSTLNLNHLFSKKNSLTPSKSSWFVNGGSVRPSNQAIGYPGKRPPLTAASLPIEPVQVKSYHSPSSTSKVLSNNHSSQRNSPSKNLGATPPKQVSSEGPLLPQSFTSRNISPTDRNISKGPVQSNLHLSSTSTSSSPMSHPQFSQDAALAAYQAYQQTMQQFLMVQEQVMRSFLMGGGQLAPNGVVGAGTSTPNMNAWPSQLPNGQQHPNFTNSNGASAPAMSQRLAYDPGQPPSLNGGATYNGHNMAPPETIHGSIGASALPMPAAQPMPVNAPSAPSPVPVPPPAMVKAPPVIHEPATHVSESNSPLEPSLDETLNRDTLTSQLLDLVSDRTGYPAEMLGLDQDLEAELGIDSIKRVEIFGGLQKLLPTPLARALQAQMEQLTRLKSLNAIVDYVLTLAETPEQETASLGKSSTASLTSPAI